MAKVDATTDARILAGIDISRSRHDVVISVPGRTGRKRLTVLNNGEDDERLIGTLCSFGLPVTIGFEGQGTALTAIVAGR